MGVSASSPRNGRSAVCCNALAEEKTALLESSPPVVDEGAVQDNIVRDGNQQSDVGNSIIQFNTAIYFALESEGEASIDVVRLGSAERPASVSYYCVDGSAKNGRKYHARNGTLHFDVGELLKTIQVPVVQDEVWDATLEFSMHLANVRGVDTHLGRYLHVCLVKVLDDDAFPTNKHRDLVRQQQTLQEIPGLSLLIEYMKMNMANPLIYNGVALYVTLDCIKALYFFLTLYLQLYLVDEVLAPVGSESEKGTERLLQELLLGGAESVSRIKGPSDDVEQRKSLAVIVGVLYIAPFAVNHAIDFTKMSLHVAGESRKTLQANLFRRFLHYVPSVRSKISTGDLTMAMSRDIQEVVNGFMKLLRIVQIVLKLLCSLIFVLSENVMAAIPLAVFPVVMGAFLSFRERTLVEAAEASAVTENHLVHQVHSAVSNFRLIADFGLRSFIVSHHEDSIDVHNHKVSNLRQITVNNEYLSPWLITGLIGCYIIFGTSQVVTLGGSLSLGAFLGTIAVFKEIGREIEELYREMLEIQSTFGPLKTLCYFLNLPTDLNQRMLIGRHRRRIGKEQRDRERSKFEVRRSVTAKSSFAVDNVKIELRGVTFWYPGYDSPLLRGLNHSFEQGALHAFIGARHQGKATLLRLLGEMILPSPGCGDVFVPPHLRILHMSREVCVLHDSSLLENLIFNSPIERLGGLPRILDVCQQCGFSETVLAEVARSAVVGRQDQATGSAFAQRSSPIEEVFQDTPGSANLCRGSALFADFSQTDLARLSLARAMIMNPECLVMHMPLVSFSDTDAADMMSMIQRHASERGLAMPATERDLRRPRTVFMSSSALDRCKGADVVFEVSSEKGLTPVAGKRMQNSK